MIFHDWTETEIIPDPFAWYQYTPSVSGHNIIYDSVADKHITCDAGNSPVLTEDVISGHPAWYFDGTRDPLVYSGAVTIKHAFILASNEDATFATYQGLLTGESSGDVLVGDNGQTKFFDLGLGLTYYKEGASFDEDDQQAPMSGTFRLLEASLGAGFGLDGIQVGQQKADATRKWQGHFVEMILFDRVLTATEVRRVRLYFNVKFGEHARGLRFEFPSADIVPTIGPSRFYDVPPDYKTITDEWEYEDRVKDFNEVADNPPKFWEYAYPAVEKSQLPIFNEFWNQARLINPFYFRDPDGITWNNVRVDDYNRNHQAHRRWAHDVAFRLVGYNSVGVPDTPPTLPDTPVGLALEVLSESEILATWEPALDVTAPSVPTMDAGDVISDTEIDWSWSASSDDVAVTGYDLQVSTSSDFTTGVTTHNLGNVLTYSATGLTGGTTYYARVRAHDAVPNNSAYSSSVNATTDAGGFSPEDVTGLYIWHDASQLSLSDGDPVSSWTDESGNARHSTASSTQRPIFKTGIVNSLPVVRFDGTNQYLEGVNISALTEGEAILVFKLDADPPAEPQSGFWGIGADTSGTHLPYTDGKIYDAFGTTARKDTGISTGGVLDTGFHIYCAYSASADWACYLDDETTPFYSTGTNTVGFPGTAFRLGSHSSTAYKIDGDIAEFILYDHKLDGTERTQVFDYLRDKYGL